MSVAAVVVTRNRPELLVRCLRGILAQSPPPDEVIVVDNASDDGTAAMVAQAFPDVTVHRLERNVGGAGGFAWGMELGLARGHDHAWLMDDDCLPLPGSLAASLSASSGPHPPAFVASLVVDEDGDVLRSHVPPPVPDAAGTAGVSATGTDRVQVGRASFVGLLVDLSVAARTALPRIDYFLWEDDVEYTTRLATLGWGCLAPASRVQHPRGRPAADLSPLLLYCHVRNTLWLTRSDLGRRDAARKVGRMARNVVGQRRRIVTQASVRRAVACGLWHGLARRPRTFLPGQLTSTDPTPQPWPFR